MENIIMKKNTNKNIETFEELEKLSDYSFVEKLNSDPDAKFNGDNLVISLTNGKTELRKESGSLIRTL